MVGIDVTPAQLATARRCQEALGLEFPLIEASADNVPLPDAGLLLFLRNSTLVILCSPDEGQAEERLLRPQFGMGRFEWSDGGVEFHLAHGDWVRVLRGSGFEVEDLVEIQAPSEAGTHPVYDYVSADWGRRWPA